MKALWAALALALAAAPAAAEIRQADVTGGTVEGEVADGLSQFKGIPFAAPPVDDLRWQAPQPVVPWLGTRQANAFGPACMQGETLARQMGTTAPISEDCLYLDIWTPAAAADAKLPVVVWIYGGGFNAGATSVPLYDGANFARQGVVFVSLAYRLGPFGFLATPELSAESGMGSGNWGLLDLVAGLAWVRANVAQFGGDPGNVTILGHSAGSMAVSNLVASPLARGLFDKAIAESGATFAPPQGAAWAGGNISTLAYAETNGQAWLESLGARTLEQARALPAQALDEAQRAPGAPAFRPVMDGVVVPGDQYALWGEHRFADVPLLVGATSAEWGAQPTTATDFEERVRRDYGERAPALLAVYPHASDAEASTSATLLGTDSFVWNAYTWARLQAEKGTVPVFAYRFHRPTAQNPLGSPHGSEVALVFGNEDKRPSRPGWSEADRALSRQLQGYWVNFARTGDPNGPGLPAWPAFAAGRATVMQLGAETGPIALPGSDRLAALDGYFAWRRGGSR
ncbi:MAG TPA: carboxylesterase family protein [Croceibacterium sp.]